MRSRDDLHGYQHRAVDFVKSTSACALWVGMGLGKTAATLTAIADLLATFDAHRVLVIAPLRVALTTWPAELREWSHVSHLSACVLAGRPPRTRGGLALTDTADLHIINRELVPWLVSLFRDTGRPWPYDMVVIDEASSFKSHSAQRFKALRKVLPRVSRMVQLTGTPTSNGLLDLWAQIFLLDRGERLGRAYTKFQQSYFDADYMGFQLTPRPGAEDRIHASVSDIVLSMSAADYLNLPPVVVNDISVTLPDAARTIYSTLERDFLVEIEDETVAAFSAAALAGKLLQAANGAVYTDDTGAWAGVHDAKLDALAEIVESTGGAPLLVAYNFRSDATRIAKRFPQAEVLGKDPAQIDRWNRGEIPMLVTHPAAAGHGLNLQHGGRHVVWFGLNWSLELYQQFNARLARQGQTERVILHRIIAENTIDRAVVGSVTAKGVTQAALLAAVKQDAAARRDRAGA